jgi:hypothetical protein
MNLERQRKISSPYVSMRIQNSLNYTAVTFVLTLIQEGMINVFILVRLDVS